MDSSRLELVDEIVRRHLAEGDVETISASDVARYVSSGFALFCDLFAPEGKRDEDSVSLPMRRERGLAHEEEMIGGETIPVRYETIEDGFRLTVESMAEGVPVIYNMPLVSKPAGMVGRPDQLVKVQGLRSVLGNYCYRVVEVKSHFNLRREHIIQAAFYNRLLGLIQGMTPEAFTMLDGRGKEIDVEAMRSEYFLHMSIQGTREVMSGYMPSPIYGQTPAPWKSFGDKIAEGDLTRLWQIGYPRRQALMEAGYFTMADVADANEEDLALVPKIDRYVAAHISAQAKAILRGAPVFRNPVRLPRARAEMFLDMENCNEGIDVLMGSRDGFFNYLTGFVLRSGEEVKYVPFFAETKTPAAEEKCWRQFCEDLLSIKAPILYYWGASAERVYIGKMVSRYGVDPIVQNILDKAMDLCRVTTDAVAFPSESYGLKDIAGYLNFECRLPDYDGLWAMARYEQYVNSRSANIREELLTYNEDDCRALMHVKDWLVENSP